MKEELQKSMSSFGFQVGDATVQSLRMQAHCPLSIIAHAGTVAGCACLPAPSYTPCNRLLVVKYEN